MSARYGNDNDHDGNSHDKDVDSTDFTATSSSIHPTFRHYVTIELTLWMLNVSGRRFCKLFH